MSTLKTLKNQVYVLSCALNDEGGPSKGCWFKKRFAEVVSPLPDFPASCIIIGHSEKGSKIIDYVSSKKKLRSEMRMGVKKVNGKEKTRYMWLKELVLHRAYVRIEFQPVVS